MSEHAANSAAPVALWHLAKTSTGIGGPAFAVAAMLSLLDHIKGQGITAVLVGRKLAPYELPTSGVR